MHSETARIKSPPPPSLANHPPRQSAEVEEEKRILRLIGRSLIETDEIRLYRIQAAK
jgi:hypothetical protein